MRIQNQLTSLQSIYEFPLNEVSTLVMPSLSQAGCEYESSEVVCKNEDSAAEEEYISSSMPISIPGKITLNLKLMLMNVRLFCDKKVVQ